VAFPIAIGVANIRYELFDIRLVVSHAVVYTAEPARTCTVTVPANGRLDLTIADDGTPPAVWRPGIGIRSLRERAEELSGTASVGPVDGGGSVQRALQVDDPSVVGRAAAPRRKVPWESRPGGGTGVVEETPALTALSAHL
jgi:hypothetical protein